MTSKETVQNPGPLDIVKYKWFFLIFSVLYLVPGIVFMVMNTMELGSPIRLGIDFTGGTLLEYGFEKPVEQKDLDTIRTVFEDQDYAGAVVQIQQPRVGINREVAGKETATPADSASEATDAVTAAETSEAIDAEMSKGDISTIVSIRTKQINNEDLATIQQQLEAQFGEMTVLQKNTIGPALASELLKNGLLALTLAYLLIVGYLTFRFELDYALCAIIALVGDALFVLGAFAIFGNLFHTEIDSLFITAILTVVGFSVHDTIVVFDRVRENYRVYFTKKVPFGTIVNISVNQTLARSINTSLTILFPLVALYFFGGDTTRDFVLAIGLGVAIGTYSSIFVASALLALWRERNTSKPAGIATATA